MDLSLSDAYQEHVLNDPTVCNNCFGLQREAAVDVVPTSQINKAALQDHPVITQSGANKQDLAVVTHHPRRQDRTTVEHTPTDRAIAGKRVFCGCGVDGSFCRIWDYPETAVARELALAWLDDETDPAPRVTAMDDATFKSRLKRLVRTVEASGVSIERKPFLQTALAARKEGAHPDEAFSRGLEAGIQHAEIRSRPSATRARAD
jgi:hypothetical protein